MDEQSYFRVLFFLVLLQKLENSMSSSIPIISIDNITPTSVRLNWTQSTTKLPYYKINYWTNQHGIYTIITVRHDRTSYTISGLSGCTNYNVSIKAVSKIGNGPSSSTKTFTTKSKLPSVPPENVQVVAEGVQSLKVSWKVPSGVRCPPDGYKVIYSLTSGGNGQKHTVDVDRITSYTLNNLKKWTEYDISVQVRNDKGYGPLSVPIVKRTMEEAPDAPPENFKVTAISSTSVQMSWALPPVDKRNGIIKGFRVRYCKANKCSSQGTYIDLSAGTRSHKLNNLDMYTEYSFKILAYTVADGLYTNTITIRTHEGPPSAPGNVDGKVIEPNDASGPQVKFTWHKPSPPNGIIVGYKVSLGKSGGPSVKKILDSNTLYVSFPVCGEVTYDFQMWAYNSKAEGQSVSYQIKVPSYVPNNAQNLTSSEHNATMFKLSWDPIASTNGGILTYEVEQLTKQLTNVSCNEVACRGTANHLCTHTMYNLPQCSKYTFRVRGYTNKGPGLFSKPTELVTHAAPGAPQELTVLKSEMDTIILEWKAPLPLEDPVKKYTVSYSEYGCICEKFSLNGKKETLSTKITITGLHPATSYTFTVTATTKCGEGKESNAVTVKTKTGDVTVVVVLLSFLSVSLLVNIMLVVYIICTRNKTNPEQEITSVEMKPPISHSAPNKPQIGLTREEKRRTPAIPVVPNTPADYEIPGNPNPDNRETNQAHYQELSPATLQYDPTAQYEPLRINYVNSTDQCNDTYESLRHRPTEYQSLQTRSNLNNNA